MLSWQLTEDTKSARKRAIYSLVSLAKGSALTLLVCMILQITLDICVFVLNVSGGERVCCSLCLAS